jgi:prolyl-tRNA synthetase
MRLSRLLGQRLKDTPREAVSASHQFLLRGAYVRPVASGIYSALPLGRRVLAKLEALVREEMNAIDGQEVLLPVVQPRELWEESGRYGVIDQSLARFKDRTGKDMVLAMTHEEAVVALARSELESYKQLPFMLYQVQTKFRDEARPRGGLIRVREFTMKDAYSFHATKEDLEAYYERCHQAYARIFARAGLKNSVVVQSDTGMMGGAVAHEFMLVTPIGEDSLVLCRQCGYAANNEVAVGRAGGCGAPAQELRKVATPGIKTIEDLSKFLGVSAAATAKAVFLATPSGVLVMAIVRGDRELNEVKLSKVVRETLAMAPEAMIRAVGAEPGFASPYGLTPGERFRIVVDETAFSESALVAGANEADMHFTGFSAARDLPAGCERADVSLVAAGDACARCGGALELTRGIEVGNIFQLGTKYSEAMKLSYLDERGTAQPAIMGCYGIGIGRLMAAVIEDSHDAYGPIWPWSIAPFHVHLCVIEPGAAGVGARAAALYGELTRQGYDVLWDDTDQKPGAQFAAADLIGAPLRLTISPKTEARGVVEYKWRDGRGKGEVAPDGVSALF